MGFYKYCKACHINHTDKNFRLHKKHIKNLEEYMNKIVNKINDVKFFMNEGSKLSISSEFWCPFCGDCIKDEKLLPKYYLFYKIN